MMRQEDHVIKIKKQSKYYYNNNRKDHKRGMQLIPLHPRAELVQSPPARTFQGRHVSGFGWPVLMMLISQRTIHCLVVRCIALVVLPVLCSSCYYYC